VFNTLLNDTRNALIGIVLLLVSLPYYYYQIRRSRARNAPPPA